jgi:hypothetical protein
MPWPGGGVVLDLDGEVAVDGLDEDLVVDGDVRVLALHLLLAAGRLPGEIVGARADVVVLAARVHVGDAPRRVDAPAEHLQVARRRGPW